MISEKIDTYIEACLTRLSTTLHRDPLLEKYFPHTLFPAQIIASCLDGISGDRTAHHIETIVEKTVAKRNFDWSWNYLRNDAKKIYPNDLDDTFVSLALISRHRPHLLDTHALSSIAELLKSTQIENGGPYNTWCIDYSEHPAWHDVDPVVNSNIAFFFHINQINFTKLYGYIEHVIDTRNYSSKYYCNRLVAMYSIARWYSGSKTPQLVKHIFQELDMLDKKGQSSLLLRAFAVSSLVRLGADQASIAKNIQIILASEGMWTDDPLYYEYRGKTKNIHIGHTAITISACLEAMTLVKNARVKKQSSKLPWLDMDMRYLFVSIRAEAIADITNDTNLPYEFKISCLWWLRKIIEGDTGKEILLIPSLFNQQETQQSRNFGKANAYGWIAYTIYDDAYDEGDTRHLGVANYFLRRSYQAYKDNQTGCDGLIDKIFSTIDSTNDDEQRQDSSPQFENLYKKSAGHVLGFLIGMIEKGFSEESIEYRNLAKTLENYLCIRQISDDLHDWHEDLLMGTATPVTESILQTYRQLHKSEPDLFENDTTTIKKIFVEHTIPHFAEKVMEMRKASMQLLSEVEYPFDTTPLVRVVNYYSTMVTSTSMKYYFEHKMENGVDGDIA